MTIRDWFVVTATLFAVVMMAQVNMKLSENNRWLSKIYHQSMEK